LDEEELSIFLVSTFSGVAAVSFAGESVVSISGVVVKFLVLGALVEGVKCVSGGLTDLSETITKFLSVVNY